MKYLLLIPTLFRYWGEIAAVLKGAREIASKIQSDTGIDFGDALKGTLATVAKSIPKPQEIKPGSEEERVWFDRGTGPAN